MGAGLIFSGEGFDAFGMILDRFAHRIADPTPVWNELADRFVDLQAKNFASEGAVMSGGWAPLSPDYKQYKARAFPGKGILVRTGDLEESLAGVLGIREFDRKSMTVGTQISYAAYHQLGTKRMRARRLIGDVPVSEQLQWAKVLQKHLVEGIL